MPPIYKQNINYENHQFNSTEVLIDKIDVAKSVISIMFEPIDDDYEIDGFPDGTAIGVEIPTKKLLITLEVSDASPTTDVLWDLHAASDAFAFSMSDANAPTLKASAQQCRFNKRPPLKRAAKPDNVIWTFMTPYGEYRGGSYKLISV